MNSTHDSARLLRLALGTNALYTGLWGLGLIEFGRSLAPVMGLSAPMPLYAVAAVFLGMGAALFVTSRRVTDAPSPFRAIAALLTVGDVGYIAASVAVAAWPGLLNATGRTLVVAVAATVAVLVGAQTVGLRRLAARA